MKAFSSAYARDAAGLVALVIALLIFEATISGHFYRGLAMQAIIFAIAATGLTLLIGFAGQISIGHNAFVGIGAYCVAWFVQKQGWHPLPALLVATVGPAVLAYVLARPILRLSGHYLALATLALGSAAYIFASQWHEVTGGFDPGIVDLPRLVLVGDGSGPDQLFLFASLSLVVVVGLSLELVHSSVGRALRTIHTSELVAAGSGINVEKAKAAVFALSAGYAGLAGGLFAYYLRSFNASSFSIMMAIELLMMVIVGSLSTVWGALIGAALIVVLPHALEHFEVAKLFVYGTVMTLVVMYLPNGLASSLFSAGARLFRSEKSK